MPNFCVKCGAPLSGGPFCVKCGADTRSAVPSARPQSQPNAIQPPSPQPAAETIPPAPGKQGMSALAKVGVAAVVIIFVGGAASAVGVYYAAHRVSQKIHQAADGILRSTSDSHTAPDHEGSGLGESESSRSTESGSMGDVCRLLTKQDVSKAVGVEIVRTESKDNGCSYLAKGTQQEMTAKHVKAMMADKGVDKKTQEIAEKFAGGMFNALQAEKPASGQNTSGEVPVFVFSLEQHGAEEQMRLNAKVFGNLGNEAGLPGIGDQAFVSADGMIMVRKGKTLVRIMYLVCPCGVEQVKPLAKEIADAL
jgi:hypothetical protein